jgi:formyltetrahydrofolate hydrolase
VTPETKSGQERKLAEIIEEERIALVVLARYMQVVSITSAPRIRSV